MEEIRAAQRRCSIAAHPDRQPDAVRRRSAVEEASRINAAAGDLLDSLSRGRAILELLAPNPRPTEPRQDPAFLMRIMELRESVDAAGRDGAERRKIAEEVRRDLAHVETETDTAMAALIARPDAASWTAACDALNRLRALRRAGDECLP